MITQRDLDLLCQAEEYAKVNRANIKERMLKNEQVEPGPITAKVTMQVKRTPDYQGYILANCGQQAVADLKINAKPVQYAKLDIFQPKLS